MLFLCLEEIKKAVRGKEMIPREIAGVLFRLYTEMSEQIDVDDYKNPMLYVNGKLEGCVMEILGENFTRGKEM